MSGNALPEDGLERLNRMTAEGLAQHLAGLGLTAADASARPQGAADGPAARSRLRQIPRRAWSRIVFATPTARCQVRYACLRRNDNLLAPAMLPSSRGVKVDYLTAALNSFSQPRIALRERPWPGPARPSGEHRVDTTLEARRPSQEQSPLTRAMPTPQ